MSQETAVARTATAALLHLWHAGFFREWRTKAVVEAQLAKGGYHFSGPELGMALMRAKHLTRKGTKGSYHYIQKYPFVSEVKVSKKSTKRKVR